MCPDNMIIHRTGAFAVLSPRHEVMWPDGSAVVLHPALRLHPNGESLDSRYLRAVGQPLPQGGQLWLIVDLRTVAPPLADDLPAAFAKDVPGLVFYTLRARYRNAAQFLGALLPLHLLRDLGRADLQAAA